MTKFMKQLIDLLEKLKMEFKEHMRLVERNQHWQKEIPWNLGIIIKALNLDANIDTESKYFIRQVKKFQAANNLNEDGILGPKTYEEVVASQMSEENLAIDKIVKSTILRESGGLYTAMNKDGEFNGSFDKVWNARHGHDHPASGKTHIGLSFGIIQFTQDGGALGKLLSECAKKDSDRFKRIIGPTWQELLQVTNQRGPSGLSTGSLRGPRVQKVLVAIDDQEKVRADLWERPWTDIFARLGNDPVFQGVQNQLAVDEYLKPILPFLKENSLVSEKAVAIAFDLAVHRGVGGARKFIRGRLDPGKSELEILKDIAESNVRSNKILEDNSLSMSAWRGFDV